MRVAVFGASGGIGRLVVSELLQRGDDAVALVRTPGKLGITHERLTVITGELSDAAAVHTAVAGADAVISALGPALTRGATGTPVTDGTRTIVAAMDAAGVHRFVGLATPSVPDPQDLPTVTGRIIPLMARVFLPNALAELQGMTAAVTSSDLDWTIARITRPTDAPPTGTLRAGFLGRDKVGFAMSRADIATFLVDQLTSTQYLRAMPAISN